MRWPWIILLVLVVFGGTVVWLVSSGRVGIYATRVDPDAAPRVGLQVVAPIDGSRAANRVDESLALQAPLSNPDLFPKDPAWWTSRCAGFFGALWRAQLDLRFGASHPQDGTPIFPILTDLPEKFNGLISTDPATVDHLRRYERSFPEDPKDILQNNLYLTDLPRCEAAVKGLLPPR